MADYNKITPHTKLHDSWVKNVSPLQDTECKHIYTRGHIHGVPCRKHVRHNGYCSIHIWSHLDDNATKSATKR